MSFREPSTVHLKTSPHLPLSPPFQTSDQRHRIRFFPPISPPFFLSPRLHTSSTLTPSPLYKQIHNARIPRPRNPSPPPHSRHKRRLLALGRHPLPQKRSLPRRHRIPQPPRLLHGQRPPQRNPRRRQTQMLPLGDARATPGIK